jgi:hypothetical protein
MVAAEAARAYPPLMRTGVGAAIDSWLEQLGVTWVRRQRPVLRLVPARWIRPVIKPSVLRLRRSLSRGAVELAVSAGMILTLLILMR